MSNPILPDTTLAAIVRDEEDNPAWGVEAWLRATLPFVEHAVVVDTGSIDRTREILEMLKTDFPHLEVYDRPFDDFASSRNFSIGKVRTRGALILDADELLIPEEYARLTEYAAQNPARGYNFTFKQIYAEGAIFHTVINMQILRLFDVKGAIFRNKGAGTIYEDVRLPDEGAGEFPYIPMKIAVIKHFLPGRAAHDRKNKLWYDEDQLHEAPPLEHAEMHGWKERNGGRRMYFGNTEENLRENFPELVAE